MSHVDYLLRVLDKTDEDFLKHLDLACSMLDSDNLYVCKSDYVFLVVIAACHLVDAGFITNSDFLSLVRRVYSLDKS